MDAKRLRRLCACAGLWAIPACATVDVDSAPIHHETAVADIPVYPRAANLKSVDPSRDGRTGRGLSASPRPGSRVAETRHSVASDTTPDGTGRHGLRRTDRDISVTAYEEPREVTPPDSTRPARPDGPGDHAPPDFRTPPAPSGSTPRVARTAPVSEGGLSLGALEELALQNNPTLRQANAQIQRARGTHLQVGLYPNPVAGYVGSEIGNEGKGGQQGGFVSQNVVTGRKLEINRSVASWDVERARLHAEAQRLRVLNAVRAQYFTILGIQRTVEVAEGLVGVVKQGADIAEQLVKGQQAPRTDLLQAQVELNTVQLMLRTAQRQELAARREMAALVGIPELPPEPLAGSLEDGLPVLDYESDWVRLQEASPMLQAARTQVQRAKCQLKREQVEPIPDLQLMGSVQKDLSSNYTIAGAQIGVILPIHNRNQGNVMAAVGELRRASENVKRVEQLLRQRLAEAYQRYEVAKTQVELYRDEILPKSEESLRLTTAGYRAGEIDFFRVLTARRTYTDNEVAYVRALAQLRVAQVEIEGLLLTGGLDDPSEPQPPGSPSVGSDLSTTPKTE